MAAFVSLEKQPQSAVKVLNMQTMCSSIFGGKTTKGLLSTMCWSGRLVLILDHDSPWRCCLWNEVTPTEEVSPLSTAHIVRVYYTSCVFNFTAHWEEIGGF
jgi:hypothetical protein